MLAINSDFHGTGRNSADIRESLAKIARAGFSHVHWCHEWTGSYIYSVHEMHQIREWRDQAGLAVKGVHASAGEYQSDLKDYTSSNEHNRLAGVELVKNRIDLAHILDAGDIVLHFYPQDSLFQKAMLSFNELEPYCKDRGIRICIENAFEIAPADSRYIFDTLFKTYDSEFMGLCFDTGHALMACKENALEYAERYNDRIFMIHLHDNHGEHDEHLIPFEARFNWDAFAPILARSPYSLPAVIESIYKGNGNEQDWLQKARVAGSRFSEMIQKYQN